MLDRFKTFVGDGDVTDLGADDVRRFLARPRTDYKPQRFSGDTKPVSDKTALNFYTALSSFWSWLVSEKLAEHNVVRTLPAPKASLPVVEPFTKDEIIALVKACDETRQWHTRGGSRASAATSDVAQRVRDIENP